MTHPINLSRMTASQIAALYGVSPRAVGFWPKRGCPRAADKTFDLGRVILWHESEIQNEVDQKIQALGKETPSLERWRQARAATEELRLKNLKGELISIEEVEEARVQRVLILKRYLLALPRRLGPALEGMTAKEAEALLNEHLRDLIAQFAGQGPENDKPNRGR